MSTTFVDSEKRVEEEERDEPKAKKARHKKTVVRRGWEESLLLNNHQRFGLADLFGYGNSSSSSSSSRSRSRRSQTQQQHQTPDDGSSSLSPASSSSSSPQRNTNSEFYTLRLEHREGGAVAQHAGEERILMFRSDRPGAIAKIIYSSTPPSAPAPTATTSCSSMSSGRPHSERSNEQLKKQDEDVAAAEERDELSEMAQAKIHVLNIKESYRGHDLGSLLFTEAVASLQNRYMNHREPTAGSGARRQQLQQMIRCQLDAEEDLRRHDKLVSFYKNLGCSIKPDAKIQFINNNDGETYRKVPMQRTLHCYNNNNSTTTTTTTTTGTNNNQNNNNEQTTGSSAASPSSSSSSSSSLVLDRKNCQFIPISLVCGTCGCKQRGVNSSCLSSSSSLSSATATATVASSNHHHHGSSSNGRVDWLLVEDGQGNVEFRTTQGRYLRGPLASEERHGGIVENVVPASSSSPTEKQAAVPHSDPNHSSGFGLGSKFQLLRVSDQPYSSALPFAASDNDSNISLQEQQQALSKPNGRELWVLQSTSGASFLTLDHNNHSLRYSKTPAFWQANTIQPDHTNHNNNNHNNVNNSSLVCTTDTPLRRRHYFYQWTKQTVDHCMSMRQRYLDGFRTRNKEMTLQDALLKVAKTIPAKSFRINDNDTEPMKKIQMSTSGTPTQQRTSPPSLCARCFQNAQAFRRAGHPDWVQLLALLYCLASVVKCIDVDDDENDDDGDDSYDWTIPSQTWVVGCAPPSSVIFGEFQAFNKDQQDSRYNSRQGMYPLHCGLDSVLLPWTGPEYMYHMLRHNNIAVPQEGMKMLRLASLYDWHTGDEYGHLANQDDLDAQPFVSDYGHLFQDAVRAQTCNTNVDDDDEALPSDEECDRLWATHYSDIANKYNVGSVLCW